MKTIAVVAMEKTYANTLRYNLNKYLSNYATFNSYSLEEIANGDMIQEDFVVIATFTILNELKSHMRSESNLIVVTVTPNKEKMRILDKLPDNTRVLLVNFDYRTCVQTITKIYGIGYSNLELVPYYGQQEIDCDIKLAITPNELRLVPKWINEVIDIGESEIEYNSLYRIAEKLNVEKTFADNEGKEARKYVYYSNLDIENLLGESKNLSEKIKVLIELINKGVILTDAAGNILLANNDAKRIMKSKSDLIIGFEASELIPEINNITRYNGNITEELIKINDENVIISISEIISNSEKYGSVITLERFDEVEDKQIGIRSKLSNSGHKAKYTFEDILGVSKSINNCKLVGRKMARLNSSVLITGESGTGKELFAQSIHNASNRRRYNFVAVNCSAIPDNLLESEMFGYEEGSFTGAKKGGKIGFFELAHKGTIFLDEIGEMPVLLQVKLLRAIEEKKIMKVGSNKIVDVDVRIIAATNKNLLKMIQEGTFREDLYYRLNVLPIQLPPLRKRKEDIECLINYFKGEIGNFNVSNKALDVLKSYSWHGNIRELRNVVEYLYALQKDVICPEDLPVSIVDNLHIEEEYVRDEEDVLSSKSRTFSEKEWQFFLQEGKNLDQMYFVLSILRKTLLENRKVGRYNLFNIAIEKHMDITEAEIRYCLSKLGTYHYVKIGRGRRGSKITEEGIRLLDKIKYWGIKVK